MRKQKDLFSTLNFFLAVISCLYTVQLASAQSGKIQPGKDPYYLSVAKLSLLQKGNSFFCRYRISVNNNTSDTLHYFSRSCDVSEFYNCSTNAVTIVKMHCNKNTEIIISLAPGQKHSEELIVTGAVEQLKNAGKFTIDYKLVMASNSRDRGSTKISEKERLKLSTPDLRIAPN